MKLIRIEPGEIQCLEVDTGVSRKLTPGRLTEPSVLRLVDVDGDPRLAAAQASFLVFHRRLGLARAATDKASKLGARTDGLDAVIQLFTELGLDDR